MGMAWTPSAGVPVPRDMRRALDLDKSHYAVPQDDGSWKIYDCNSLERRRKVKVVRKNHLGKWEEIK